MRPVSQLLGRYLVIFVAVAIGQMPSFAHAKPPATASSTSQSLVNYDDPNLAFESQYVADTAANCPKTLKATALKRCLVQNGLIASEQLDAASETITEVAGSSSAKSKAVR